MPDVMHLPVGNDKRCRNIASQIKKSMHFHRCLVFPEFRPREQRQTKINGCGIQRIDCLLKLKAKVIIGVKTSGTENEHLGKVSIDSPVPYQIGVRESIPRDLATDAHVIEFLLRYS